MALQAVAPNSLMSSVFLELHCGHITVLEGGAIPYLLSFSFDDQSRTGRRTLGYHPHNHPPH